MDEYILVYSDGSNLIHFDGNLQQIKNMINAIKKLSRTIKDYSIISLYVKNNKLLEDLKNDINS